MVIKELGGKRFGRLVVIKKSGKNKRGSYIWECLCDCGNKVKVIGANLSNKNTQSCGCSRKEYPFPNTKHSLSKTRFYRIFSLLKKRCNNIKSDKYFYYGGRGIKCLWDSFEEFRDDMYESYQLHVQEFGEKNTSIDRINNDRDYCKENCKWATSKEQSRNRRTNCFIEYKGNKKTVAEFAEIFNLEQTLLWHRIFQHNWSVEKALTTPVRKIK